RAPTGTPNAAARSVEDQSNPVSSLPRITCRSCGPSGPAARIGGTIMRQHTSGWMRRGGSVLAALAATGILAVGLQAIGTAPAHAECWSPVNISCVDDTEVDTGDHTLGLSRHAVLVGEDVDWLVMQKLSDFDCSSLLAGGL